MGVQRIWKFCCFWNVDYRKLCFGIFETLKLWTFETSLQTGRRVTQPYSHIATQLHSHGATSLQRHRGKWLDYILVPRSAAPKEGASGRARKGWQAQAMTATRPQQLLRRSQKLILMRHRILFCLDYRVGAIGGRWWISWDTHADPWVCTHVVIVHGLDVV